MRGWEWQVPRGQSISEQGNVWIVSAALGLSQGVCSRLKEQQGRVCEEQNEQVLQCGKYGQRDSWGQKHAGFGCSRKGIGLVLNARKWLESYWKGATWSALPFKRVLQDWRCGSAIELLLSWCEVLGLITNTGEKNWKEKKKKKRISWLCFRD